MLTLALAALFLVACDGDPDTATSPAPDGTAATPMTATSSTPPTMPSATPTTSPPALTPTPTTPPPAPTATTTPTPAPSTSTAAPTPTAGEPTQRAQPPLTVEAAPVPPPTGEAATRLVERLSDRDYEVFAEIRERGDDEAAVREIASRLYAGDGLERFVQFALTVGQDVPLPGGPVPVTAVDVLEASPGCMFVVYQVGQLGEVQSRLVATGDEQAPAWRIESQYAEGDTATCPKG